MKDRLDSRRKAAAALMGNGGPRSNLAMEMGGLNKPAARVVPKGPADVYKRPTGKEAGSEMGAYARGGKVKAMSAPRGMVARMMERDKRADKETVKKAVHRHESHLHKGQPKTRLKDGGKVGHYAIGGAAKVRQGHGQKVAKSPRGGNPQY